MTMATVKKHKNIGSSVDAFLASEGILEQANEAAVNAVLAWQLTEEMKSRGIGKAAFARLLGTNRAQLDRWLNPDHEKITVATLNKVANRLGKTLLIRMV
jgi:antitoxin HicB